MLNFILGVIGGVYLTALCPKFARFIAKAFDQQ